MRFGESSGKSANFGVQKTWLQVKFIIVKTDRSVTATTEMRRLTPVFERPVPGPPEIEKEKRPPEVLPNID